MSRSVAVRMSGILLVSRLEYFRYDCEAIHNTAMNLCPQSQSRLFGNFRAERMFSVLVLEHQKAICQSRFRIEFDRKTGGTHLCCPDAVDPDSLPRQFLSAT